MDAEALPGYLRAIKARAEAAAVPVAGAMGKAYEAHLKDITLIESGTHPPVTLTPAAPGRPPAMITGRLRDSVIMLGPASGGEGIGFSSVMPTVIYACVQELGGVHESAPGRYMWLWVRYLGHRGVLARGWNVGRVTIPPRPYMRTATAETVASGELHRAARETFDAVVWGH